MAMGINEATATATGKTKKQNTSNLKLQTSNLESVLPPFLQLAPDESDDLLVFLPPGA